MTTTENFPAPGLTPALPIPESYWVMPGRLLAGEYLARPSIPWMVERRLDGFLEAGINTFINLTWEGEVEDYSSPLKERAEYYGLSVECLRFPIGDFSLPTHSMMIDILDAVDLALARERKVYVHCYGGIGRTGLAVGCFLVRHGRTGQQALQELAAWWRNVPKSAYHPNSPETVPQQDFVLQWSEP